MTDDSQSSAKRRRVDAAEWADATVGALEVELKAMPSPVILQRGRVELVTDVLSHIMSMLTVSDNKDAFQAGVLTLPVTLQHRAMLAATEVHIDHKTSIALSRQPDKVLAHWERSGFGSKAHTLRATTLISNIGIVRMLGLFKQLRTLQLHSSNIDLIPLLQALPDKMLELDVAAVSHDHNGRDATSPPPMVTFLRRQTKLRTLKIGSTLRPLLRTLPVTQEVMAVMPPSLECLEVKLDYASYAMVAGLLQQCPRLARLDLACDRVIGKPASIFGSERKQPWRYVDLGNLPLSARDLENIAGPDLLRFGTDTKINVDITEAEALLFLDKSYKLESLCWATDFLERVLYKSKAAGSLQSIEEGPVVSLHSEDSLIVHYGQLPRLKKFTGTLTAGISAVLSNVEHRNALSELWVLSATGLAAVLMNSNVWTFLKLTRNGRVKLETKTVRWLAEHCHALRRLEFYGVFEPEVEGATLQLLLEHMESGNLLLRMDESKTIPENTLVRTQHLTAAWSRKGDTGTYELLNMVLTSVTADELAELDARLSATPKALSSLRSMFQFPRQSRLVFLVPRVVIDALVKRPIATLAWAPFVGGTVVKSWEKRTFDEKADLFAVIIGEPLYPSWP